MMQMPLSSFYLLENRGHERSSNVARVTPPVRNLAEIQIQAYLVQRLSTQPLLCILRNKEYRGFSRSGAGRGPFWTGAGLALSEADPETRVWAQVIYWEVIPGSTGEE